MENKVKGSILIKSICYCLLFVLLLLSGYSLMCYFFYREVPEITSNKEYYQTEEFANLYAQKIYYNYRNLNRQITDYEKYKTYLTDGQGVIKETDEQEKRRDYYYGENEIVMSKGTAPSEDIYYKSLYDSLSSNFKYLIISNGVIITNVNKTIGTDSVEKIKEYLLKQNYFWASEKGDIKTNIEELQKDKILYNESFENIVTADVTVYTALNTDSMQYNEFDRNEALYNIFQNFYIGYEILPISAFLSILLAVFLTISTGHRKNKKEITINFIDKIPLEVMLTVMISAITIEVLALNVIFIDLTADILYENSLASVISILSMVAIIYTTIMILYATLVRRIKAKMFWKNTLCYRLWRWFKKNIIENIKKLFSNIKTNKKVTFLYIGFVIILWILTTGAYHNFFIFLIMLAFLVWTFKKMMDWVKQSNKVKDMIQDIYNGKTETKLDEEEFKGELKEVVKQLNDIAGGFSNAIEENLKSERMKTELITNVSHDLKTPLTSIINYVDLLKQENIEEEKAKEYISILDNKSQRLKKLTEDLVEASKASSGAIKLQMERLDLKELIKQVSGEFEDKFQQKELKLVTTYPEEKVEVLADSRYLYRVIENLYSNISKYALEGSRVYIDIIKNNSEIAIAIKNISKQQLNISEEELMQRFVRGDSSRNTEGSGLGLSIARSLTELQRGSFNIYLDGDLFKVVIIFHAIM